MPLIYDAAALRRELHEMPELGLKEFRTSAYVAEKLQALGIETQTNVGGTTGVVGIIRGTEPGPVVLLRADMDALPFKIDGKDCAIHACGHDAHTAMLLAAASRLVGKVRRGTLKLLFQPAEETLKGAPAMIKAGVLDDVEYAVGAHIRPIQDVPAGKICAAVRHTASATTFVTIKGRGAHAARPHLGVNTIDVACRVIGAVQDIWLNPTEVWSAKATQIHANAGATNTVPDTCTITFDVRAGKNPLMKEYLRRINLACEMTGKAMEAEVTVDTPELCPAAEYDDDLVEEIAQSIRDTAGVENLAKDCGGGGEDFHCFKMAKPELKAAYFGVGVGATPGLHAPNMTFDEQYLPLGVNVFVDFVTKKMG